MAFVQGLWYGKCAVKRHKCSSGVQDRVGGESLQVHVGKGCLGGNPTLDTCLEN